VSRSATHPWRSGPSASGAPGPSTGAIASKIPRVAAADGRRGPGRHSRYWASDLDVPCAEQGRTTAVGPLGSLGLDSSAVGGRAC